MPLSRRAFFSGPTTTETPTRAAALISARGREALVAGAPLGAIEPTPSPPDRNEVRINSNENPLGPGKAALSAITGEFGQTGRYPFNSKWTDVHLQAAIAEKFGVRPSQIVLGAGSGEILRNAVRAFTSEHRPLVTGTCTFEAPTKTAEQLKAPVKAVPLEGSLRLDLKAMAEAAKGAGLVFLCNPNNPTGTVQPGAAVAEFVNRVHESSPETAILIDEAYHDYVTDPGYRTSVGLALSFRNVFVTRTFSKCYGMAGLRVGYAIGQAETIRALDKYRLTYNVNVYGIAAALASLKDAAHIEQERARNTAVRKYTADFFAALGYKAADTQTNFIFVELGRPAKDFREACEKQRVMVGRDFPPYEKTHARISIGTMEEMRRATEVFRQVLGKGPVTTTASRG